jgi:uncharacterized DUF497 family protein
MSDASLHDCEGFDWDSGNHLKNWAKHGVAMGECEQIFFNIPLLLLNDSAHSDKEHRYFALGKTDHDRYLLVVFTKRGVKIRVISARDMNKKERGIYESAQKDS